MKIIGIILIIVGIVDVGGSWIGFDFWGEFIGIELPYMIWFLSGYAEIGLGYFLFNSDHGIEDEEDLNN